jgi:hypothetical protein
MGYRWVIINIIMPINEILYNWEHTGMPHYKPMGFIGDTVAHENYRCITNKNPIVKLEL